MIRTLIHEHDEAQLMMEYYQGKMDNAEDSLTDYGTLYLIKLTEVLSEFPMEDYTEVLKEADVTFVLCNGWGDLFKEPITYDFLCEMLVKNVSEWTVTTITFNVWSGDDRWGGGMTVRLEDIEKNNMQKLINALTKVFQINKE